MLHGIIKVISHVTKINLRNDDDLVDRLHHRFTVTFLVVFTVLISTTQYVGTAIHCWCPAYFTSSHEAFTNDVCWVSNTYLLPDKLIPGQTGARRLRMHIG